jgi:uncharacterized Tic20 family protein
MSTAIPTHGERQWAAFAHILALVLALCTGWIAGVAGMLGAGIVWFLKRDASPFVAAHAREAFNFNFSMFLYAAIAAVIAFVLVGATVLTLGIGLILTAPAGLVLALVIAAVALLWLVCSLIAASKAWNGEPYRYPLTLRLF